ncbi:hypothetical protein SAMN05216412_101184 [Nitrosospira multiformis]|uniref:Uncharacterized protein n=1 Tax=Nitrosospira multiformis TaxID=1231 RepID=A0A1H9YEC4_9PROT|nr:hypothetical protein [Nitrosospira multiformis]SES67334.1 hypothetical protein SAMN05216412_101184 [Nitrosospira multiformis]
MVKHLQGNDFVLLREIIEIFVAERDWDQFHTPKNLSSALCIEAAELVELFNRLELETKMSSMKYSFSRFGMKWLMF